MLVIKCGVWKGIKREVKIPLHLRDYATTDNGWKSEISERYNKPACSKNGIKSIIYCSAEKIDAG